MPQPWEIGDHSQRWAGYLHPVYNMTLRNKIDPKAKRIQTPGQLREAEDLFVEARSASLAANGIPPSYDLDGLRAVHRHLFQDVYPWAGDIRTVNMGKGRSGSADFYSFTDIPAAMAEVTNSLKRTDLLRNFPADKYADAMAKTLAEVNFCHSFREGNGRSQRAFLGALAGESGRTMDWTKVPAQVNDLAAKMAGEGNIGPLRDVVALALDTTKSPEVDEALEALRLTAGTFPTQQRGGSLSTAPTAAPPPPGRRQRGKGYERE